MGVGANRALELALEAQAGQRWRAGNLGRSVKGLGLAEGRAAFAGLDGPGLRATKERGAAGFARGELLKFLRCLPPAAEAALLVEPLLDGVGAGVGLVGVG